MPLAWGNSKCYASANYPDNTNDVLTVRDSPEGERTVVQNTKWSYARNEDGKKISDPVNIYLDGGFEPGKIYELISENVFPLTINFSITIVFGGLNYGHDNGAKNSGGPQWAVGSEGGRVCYRRDRSGTS